VSYTDIEDVGLIGFSNIEEVGLIDTLQVKRIAHREDTSGASDTPGMRKETTFSTKCVSRVCNPAITMGAAVIGAASAASAASAVSSISAASFFEQRPPSLPSSFIIAFIAAIAPLLPSSFALLAFGGMLYDQMIRCSDAQMLRCSDD
jgi:hypothetical protein